MLIAYVNVFNSSKMLTFVFHSFDLVDIPSMNVICPGDAQICDLRNGSANVLPLFNQSLVHKKQLKLDVTLQWENKINASTVVFLSHSDGYPC